jgi:phosphatidylserine/phosphatidylglycerophosphate/cardiolipin synthase-like enzyme
MFLLCRTAFVTFLALLVAFSSIGCRSVEDTDGSSPDASQDLDGKADNFRSQRRFEVLLTEPHCDLCDRADRDYLLAHSKIIARTVELIDGARESVDIAQFTFSRAEIEQALERAHQRGVTVRLAMNHGQRDGDNVANRLLAKGLDVRFIQGVESSSFYGLMHAKYMIVDGNSLVTGSNNWSSTGPSINEENTIVLQGATSDPMLAAFRCNFEKIWDNDTDGASACSTREVWFTPNFSAFAALRSEIRAARRSINVLMHHLIFENAIRELTAAAERGVQVRVIINAEDRESITGPRWEQFFAAGGQVRFKQTNPNAFQLMHHKLAVIDDRILFNGSGNWSGSAFFNNFEFFVRYDHEPVVAPFISLFERLWTWSLTQDSLERGYTAAEQAIFESLDDLSSEEPTLFFFADGRVPAGDTLRTVRQEVLLDSFVAWPDEDSLFSVFFFVMSQEDNDLVFADELNDIGPMSFERFPVTLSNQGSYEAVIEVHSDSLTAHGDSIRIDRL